MDQFLPRIKVLVNLALLGMHGARVYGLLRRRRQFTCNLALNMKQVGRVPQSFSANCHVSIHLCRGHLLPPSVLTSCTRQKKHLNQISCLPTCPCIALRQPSSSHQTESPGPVSQHYQIWQTIAAHHWLAKQPESQKYLPIVLARCRCQNHTLYLGRPQ